MNLAPGPRGDLRRRKWFLAGLAAVVGIFLLGLQTLYQPQQGRLQKVRNQWKALRAQGESLKTQLPDLAKEKERLKAETKAVEELEKEVKGMQSQLVTSGELGLLLGELVRCGEGLRVTFDSVKQDVRENPGQPHVTLEMALSAPFEDLVNYLNRIERLSPFLKVEHLAVLESKQGPSSLLAVRLVLDSPLRLSSETGGLTVSTGALPEKVALARAPFISRVHRADKEKHKEMKVTGITWQEGFSTAIVNEEVVRVGDKVADLTVQKILPDRVVLSDGVESLTVELTR